jgi:hypothetical protein
VVILPLVFKPPIFSKNGKKKGYNTQPMAARGNQSKLW